MNLSTITAIDPSLPQALPQVGAGQIHSLLIFHLGERDYALSIDYVVQIIPMLKLTPVPQVGQVIEGVANIHGKVVPVLSARRHLGLPLIPPQLYTPVILLRTGERMLGLIVDAVADVLHVPAGQIFTPESIMPEGYEKAAVLTGVVYQGEKAIMLLDPRYLLYPNQMRAVNRAIQALSDGKPRPGGNGHSPAHQEEPELPAPEMKNTADAQSCTPSSEETPARLEEKVETAPQPQNGREKPRRKRRKIEATLAGEIATLAVNLPPSDGSPSKDGEPSKDSSPSDGGMPSDNGAASSHDGTAPSDPQSSNGE